MKWITGRIILLIACLGFFIVAGMHLPHLNRSNRPSIRVTNSEKSSSAEEIIGFHLILK